MSKQGPVIEILGPMASEQFAGKDGRRWEKHAQPAALHAGGKYPDRFELVLSFDAPGMSATPEPYPVGFYQLGPDGLSLDRRGNLQVSRARLIPAQAPGSAQPANLGAVRAA